jgi:hypothetical protein
MDQTRNKELLTPAEGLRRRIEQRAHELYEQRGRQNGYALQDWLQAEQELTRPAEDRSDDKFFVSRAI